MAMWELTPCLSGAPAQGSGGGGEGGTAGENMFGRVCTRR